MSAFQLAERRKISMNKLVEEFSSVALTKFDAEMRFRAWAALRAREEGLKLLDLLARV